MAERADGKYAADTIAALVARQNGKGGWLEAVVLHGLFLVRDPLTLWTAHQFKTSSEAFLRIRGWVDGSDDLRRHVARVNAAHGDEGIELRGKNHAGTEGVRLRFVARSKSSGRGFSPQRVIFDEAQELAKTAQEAIVPSMRAQRNKQAIYTGTVPGPDVNYPEVFTRLRDRGRRGGSSRMAWAEWSPKGSEDPEKAALLDLNDRRHWRAANPAIGFRVTEESLESDRENMLDDSFAREALSIWPTQPDEGVSVFGPGAWEACATEDAAPTPQAIGVAVSLDRAWSSIGAASAGHVGSVQRARGTDWVVAEVVRIHAEHGVTVVVDGKGPAGSLLPALEAAGVPVIVAGTDDYVTACASLFDRVQQKQIAHGNYDDLNTAVKAADLRAVGDRWAWGRKSGDVTMLEAVTLALWGTAAVEVSVFGFDSLDLCDQCGENPHEDPDGAHDYLCSDCRSKEA